MFARSRYLVWLARSQCTPLELGNFPDMFNTTWWYFPPVIFLQTPTEHTTDCYSVVVPSHNTVNRHHCPFGDNGCMQTRVIEVCLPVPLQNVALPIFVSFFDLFLVRTSSSLGHLPPPLSLPASATSSSLTEIEKITPDIVCKLSANDMNRLGISIRSDMMALRMECVLYGNADDDNQACRADNLKFQNKYWKIFLMQTLK
ncbi:hypothetical protein MAR_007078 [Mya arenaria]|uniref:Uncharacterized protein n=1 Tax=Mya arenaria TaxID=6604 RepID=A0ABY7DCX7_MYAAR|nr:hypothetical protein MAR_007078 [Mya arenaria]